MARRASTPPPAKPSKRRLGVIVVDPLPVVRAGLRLLIDDRPDMEVLADVGSSVDGLDVIARTRRNRVVILVGVGSGADLDAYTFIRTVRERFPGHAVLGLGADAGAGEVSRALFVGADGFVDKNVNPVEFLEALRVAADGEMVLATPASVGVGDVAARIGRRDPSDIQLTEREREVLSVAAEGLTARQIAERLGVRERTITTHLARIYGKLGVGNRVAAIRTAARSGLVSAGVE